MNIYRSDIIGNAGNCLYPHKFEIVSKDVLKEAVSKDYVCAEYRNNYRSGANYVRSNCLDVS